VTLLTRELTGSPLGRIEDIFGDEGIALGPENPADLDKSVRRILTRRYLATLNLDDATDVGRLCQVLTSVLTDLANRGTDGEKEYDKFVATLRRDGLNVDPVTHRVAVMTVLLPEAALTTLPDASAIRDHLHRLAGSIDADPRLAVSVSKDLVERTARLVLRDRGRPASEKDDLPKLVSDAQRALSLDAASIEGSSSKETAALKKILGSLAAMTIGFTELRNKVGPGHGRESVPTWVQPRHARLAAGAAQVWCQLVLETLEERKRTIPMPAPPESDNFSVAAPPRL
jgi:hypothetical protein